jgi:hypothetical protein
MSSEDLFSPAVAFPTSNEYISEDISIDDETITGPPTPCAACLGIIEEAAEIEPQPDDQTDAPKHHSSARDLVGDNYLAAVNTSKLWPQGTTIHVWYIGGYQYVKPYPYSLSDSEVNSRRRSPMDSAPCSCELLLDSHTDFVYRVTRDKVTKYAVEWSKYANINFVFDRNLPGDAVNSIRVKFDDPTQGHNSLLGTDSKWDLNPQWVKHFEKKIDPKLGHGNIWPSMYLDFGKLIDEQSRTDTTAARKQELERQIRAITLHEFGHAIGMVHEHLRPDLKLILKSRPEVEAWYLQHNKTWTKDTVKENVYDKLVDKAIKMSSAPDTTSIMMYEVPKEIMGPGQKAISYNYDLSATDKSFIRQTYPGRAVVA